MSMFAEWNITAANTTPETAADLREQLRGFAGSLNDYEPGNEVHLSFETWSHFAVDDGRELLVDFSIAHPEIDLVVYVKTEYDDAGPTMYRLRDHTLRTYAPTLVYELSSEERIGA